MFLLKLNILNFTFITEERFQKISLSKKNLLNEFYDQYSFDHSIIKYHNGKKKDVKIKLPNNFKKINIEIGFGDGEYLVKNAISNLVNYLLEWKCMLMELQTYLRQF